MGLTETLGVPELIMAGSGGLDESESGHVFHLAVEAVGSERREPPGIGSAPVHESWRTRLMLGCTDRYGTSFEARQVLPSARGPSTCP